MADTATKTAILEALHATERGLDDREIELSRQRYGFNEIPEKHEAVWKQVLAQFQNTMVYILLVAVAVSLAVPYIQHGSVHEDEMINAIVIMAIVLLNAALGFFQERRAENAIALLKKLSAPQVKVRRDGQVKIIPSRELAPGDIQLLEAGDRVSADGRIILSSSCEADESSLTGESLPVEKRALRDGEGEPGRGKVFAGTVITRGSCEAVVTAIALQTEIGKITSMVMELKPPPTPLQLELKRVGEKIGTIVLGLCAVIFVLGLSKGMQPIDIFFTAVSLAVAAVPEGLPAIVTICLAIGVQRMIKKNALIRRLDAIETLGNVTVICADKTGTMTENQMKVVEVWTNAGVDETLLLTAAASCNRAELPNIGDPTEIALLDHAKQLSAERLTIDVEDVPFTSEAKYMVTSHVRSGKQVKFAKGAAEVIAGMIDAADAKRVHTENEKMAKRGLRVLAVACDEGSGLRLLGLIAMVDPARKGVKEAIQLAKKAGIRTVMITGDNPVTAGYIANEVGLETSGVIDGVALDQLDQQQLQHELKTVSVFARVQPVHKVKILEAFQAMGQVVAMSGDGVNDAPALKRSHVGVAMGMRGTDVARESGAMVLTDDNYATIVAAIAEGRRIYDNICKFIVFLLRSNVGEVLLISGAMLINFPLPLLPLHILWVNLVTDSLPALALAAEKGEENIMTRPPRRKGQNVLTGEVPLLFVAGLCNAVLSLWVFWWLTHHLGDSIHLARTGALTTTIVFQFFLALSTRMKRSVFMASPFGNPWLLGAIGISLGLHLVLLYTPMGMLFKVVPMPLEAWGVVMGATLVGFIFFEICKTAHIHTKNR